MISTKNEHISTEVKHEEGAIDPEQRRASTHAPVHMPDNLRSLSPEELDSIGRKATLKIDVIVMPCLIIMYVLNYLDRQNIASARLAGLPDDLGLNDSQYQTCVSILFVGYSKSMSPFMTLDSGRLSLCQS